MTNRVDAASADRKGGEPPEGERVAIVGDGQMGLVLAGLLSDKGVPCTVTGPFPQDLALLKNARSSPRMLGLTLPASVAIESDPAAALRGATTVVSAVPTQFIRAVWERFGPALGAEALLVTVAKGFERGTHGRPSEVLRAVTRRSARDPIVVLTGPTIAAELARRLPATMLAACEIRAAAERVQRTFGAPWLRIYTHDDAIGAEVAGAIKNVIALAAGMIDGLGLGTNAKSALLARGLAEMVRLGQALGARAETFFGIAGVGDLATTCFSPEGRNRACGEAIGRGETLEAHLARTRSVVEGVETARSVSQLASARGLELPITDAVCRILFERLSPADAIRELMTREPKMERVG